ncbi:immunoglobulin domain protein [Opisthorchis viverrini]|uniref:Immunoglobulin domain protein n=1 Tax=Opisthorchis viverrini TaxID=6198 RepID=A0A1S8X9S3_OPIVI|nr:immunoglobulin domain protein [Opisthorchis viverrini]
MLAIKISPPYEFNVNGFQTSWCVVRYSGFSLKWDPFIVFVIILLQSYLALFKGDPVIIEPSGETHLFGIQSKNLTLTCAVYGRPPPAINWRFNWGGLRDDVTYVLNTTVVDCNKVISQLTLTNLEPQASGLYTCEAVNKRRSMAPDIAVNVAKGGMCTVPFFNDGATFADECLKCYCSGVTDKCQSAKGYVKSPVNKMWKLTGTTSVIGLYSDDTGEVTTDGLQITDNLVRYTNYPEDEAYLEGEFGLQGPWVTSYGYNMKVKIRQFGPFTNFFPGALIALHDQTSTEVQDVQLEYVTPSGLTDSWVTEVEQCDCPVGYEGLSFHPPLSSRSAHSDINQTQTNPESVNRNVLAINVMHKATVSIALVIEQVLGANTAKQDSTGQSGAQWMKTAFLVKSVQLPLLRFQNLSSIFTIPQCPLHFHVSVVKECAGSTLPEQHYLCKCEVREDGKLVDPDCDQCALAEEQGIPPPPEAKCEEQPERLECNTEGTQSVLDNGDCVCKEDPAGMTFDFWLARRSIHGGLERVEDEVMGQPRLERTPTELIVRNPVLERGIIHLAVQIKPPPADSPTINDIPIYRYLYGGQMFFRLDAVNFDLSKLKAEEARVVVELESERYGRVWTQAVYNKALQTYEVQFDENWWPGGWKLGTPIEGHGQFQGLTRAQLLRVLATTSSISIVTSSGLSKGLAGMKISGLSIQLAQSVNRRPAPGGVDPNTLPQAPVEVCDCPMPSSPDERQLSPSCEVIHE